MTKLLKCNTINHERNANLPRVSALKQSVVEQQLGRKSTKRPMKLCMTEMEDTVEEAKLGKCIEC